MSSQRGEVPVDEPARPSQRARGAADAGDVSVIRREEQLLVGTDRYPVRRVRIAKRVVTETQTVSVQTRREELVVTDDALPAGGPSVPLDARDRDREIVIVLSEEVPVVYTEIRPVERVRVWVETQTREESFSADLRKERVDVDTAGSARSGVPPR